MLSLERAIELNSTMVTEESLLLHEKNVCYAMGAMAEHYGLPAEEKDHWQAIGWLHDVDYEKYPDEHCHHVREFLAPEGVEEEDIRAIISHGHGLTGVDEEPQSDLEKSLFTVDELTGIVQAYALMRPERLAGMEVKSLKKKFKDKRFAAGCNRDVIKRGFEMLGLEAGVVMEACIKGMQEHAEELGLKA